MIFWVMIIIIDRKKTKTKKTSNFMFVLLHSMLAILYSKLKTF